MDRILHWLRNRERVHRAKTTCMLFAGVPLSFVGPAAVATIFWLAIVFGSRSLRHGFPIGWLGLFAILCLIMIPLLYRLELRTGGAYFSDVLGKTNVHGARGIIAMPGIGRDIAAAGTLLANSRAASSLIVEFFLFGPRLTICGFGQARLARRVQLPDLAPAAEVIEALLRCQSGVETSSLVDANANKDSLLPVLAYLAFHQWIGVGKNWERVWLDSESRRTLQTP